MSSLPLQHRDRSLFSLVPITPKPIDVVRHPHNRHLAYRLNDDTLALDIGLHIHSKSRSPSILATLGRDDAADIFLDGPSMSRIQCSFEINLDSKVIMIVDRSRALTTQVYSADTPTSAVAQFELGRPFPPQVVIMRTLNEQLGMGGTHRDLVKFELHWHYNLDTIIDILNNRDDLPQDYKQEIEDCPRVAHTLSQELDTIPPSRMETRAHVPAQPTMRYKQFDALGNGSFGTVFKGLDLDLGRFMAIKRLEQPSDPEGAAQFQQSLRYAAKREVETLSRIKHPHIVKFYHSQGWETPSVKIFMELKEGSLGLLARRPDWPDRALHTSQLVLQQMLQALDFLAFNDVVHRDVKPENILYSSPRGTQDYTFQLGDFGLCNQSSHSTSVVGTNEFMAPEVYEGEKQSSKVDVWSLAVTLLWILDTNGFRQTFRTPIGRKPYQNEIVRAAQTYNSNVLQHMTRIDANYRATAAQLLATYFNGEGLTTRAQIPQITEPMDL